MLNVVLITTGKRPDLLGQSIESMFANAAEATQIHLTAVLDGFSPRTSVLKYLTVLADSTIVLASSQGASAARNIGASSIPAYKRGSHVCFFDDDIYACPGWDKTLLSLSRALPGALVSGHGHPYNHGEPHPGDPDAALEPIPPHTVPLVISTVNFFMPWGMWDSVGYFIEPGGPGGSEDYAWCMAAAKKGYGFAVAEPQCVIHCGLTSSMGKQIVGYAEMVAQNERLTAGMEGVQWQ